MVDLWSVPLELRDGGRVHCPNGWRLDPGWSRALPDYDLWMVCAGRGSMELKNRRVIELRRGVVVWMRPGRLYHAIQDDREPLTVCYQHFALSPSTKPRSTVIPESVLVHEVSYFEKVFEKVLRLRRRNNDSPSESDNRLADTLFRALLEEYLRPRPPPAPPRHAEAVIRRQMEAVHQHPGRYPPVNELAKAAGLNPDSYRRLFQRVTGLTPKAWIQTVRIDQARVLLGETSMSVGEIADHLGFHDAFHLSRQFKERTSLNPTTYRRQLRTNPAAASKRS